MGTLSLKSLKSFQSTKARAGQEIASWQTFLTKALS